MTNKEVVKNIIEIATELSIINEAIKRERIDFESIDKYHIFIDEALKSLADVVLNILYAEEILKGKGAEKVNAVLEKLEEDFVDVKKIVEG